MKIKEYAKSKIEKREFTRRFTYDNRYRTVVLGVYALAFNFLYAVYNGIISVVSHSFWFLTMCIYHMILCTVRLSAIVSRGQKSIETERKVMKMSGVLFTVLSGVLSGIVYLTLKDNSPSKYGEITMITIATYTFIKIALAITRAVKHREERSYAMQTIRCVSYVEVSLALLTMQMSMIASFGDISSQDSFVLNILTGIAVCLFTLAVGVILIRKGNKNG